MADPFRIWDELRRTCPVAHTDRRGSTWLPTRYQDVVDLAHDIEHFSSTEITVIPFDGDRPDEPVLQYGRAAHLGRPAPAHLDPPPPAALVLPPPGGEYEPMTRALCAELVDGVRSAREAADAARDYAQQIPVRVIAAILGVPESLSDTFTGWVRDVLEFADDPERRRRGASRGSSASSSRRWRGARPSRATTC